MPGKYKRKDPERLEIIEKCCICGRLFYKQVPIQAACNLWERPGKKQSACVHMNVYITRKKNEARYKRTKKRKKITGRPRENCRQTVKTPSGCELVQTEGGRRCQKWNTCKHKLDCLDVIPLHWKGFTSYNGCKGYGIEQPREYGGNSNYDYDTFWEVGI